MNLDSTKSQAFFRFEDLRVYHKSLDFATWVADFCTANANDESSNYFNAFNNEALEIPYNIAEGSARNKAQFIHYLKLAKSSVRKCIVQTSVGYKRGLISDETQEEIRTQLMELTKMLGALITSLQKTIDNAPEDKIEEEFGGY